MIVEKNGRIIPDKVRGYKDDAFMCFVFAMIIPCVIGGVLYIGIKEGSGWNNIISQTAFWCIIELFFIIATLIYFDKGNAKFVITEDGLWTKFPLASSKFIPWDEFQEVCVCYDVHKGRSSSTIYVVICFVKHGIAKNYKGRWDTNSFIDYRNLITMDYTYELCDEVKAKCPLGVIDLRDTPEYAIE